MTCRFQKVPAVFNKSLVDLENCTSFLKTTCDLLNSTCEIDLLKLLARHMYVRGLPCPKSPHSPLRIQLVTYEGGGGDLLFHVCTFCIVEQCVVLMSSKIFLKMVQLG